MRQNIKSESQKARYRMARVELSCDYDWRMSAARASCTGCFRWPAFARNDTKRDRPEWSRIAATLGLRHDRGRHNRVDRHNLDPLVGCTRKSAACRHCYAEALTAASAQDNNGIWLRGSGTAGPSWTGAIALREDRLALPLAWDAPRRILVNALSDLFHESAPIETIDRVFAIMALAPRHIFQILTKRPKIMQLISPTKRRLADHA